MRVRRRLATLLILAAAIAAISSAAWTTPASAASGYYVTFAARDCPSYADIYANRARNDIVESLEDLGPNTQYGSSGALVGPAYEEIAPQTNCKPLPDWKFTLGTGYQTRAVTGKWGSLSKVTGPYSTSIVTQNSTPLLDEHGDPVGSQTVAGAVTIKLTSQQASQASKSSSLWVQGGIPGDPVLASQFGTPQAPDYGFGTVRCATDNVNGDNVEYVFFPSGITHVFCYAYYVSPPPTSGTIVIHKRVLGAPAGANPAFPFGGDLSFDPNGFVLRDGQSSTFYRAGGETWTVSEGAVADYRLKAVECTSTGSGGGPGTSTTATNGGTLSIALGAGDTVDCTFVNEWVQPTGGLTIAKITEGGVGAFEFLVSPVGGGGEATAVTATTSRDGVPINAVPESALAELAPGTYTIAERKPVNPAGGWTLLAAECDGVAKDPRDVTVTVLAGKNETCTFTNKLTGGGSISLSKVTEGGTGTTAFVIEALTRQPLQFHQTATTTEPGVGAEASPDGPEDDTSHVYLGTYRIVEQPPLTRAEGEWTLTSVTCDGVEVPFSDGSALVTLNRSNPHVSCTFANAFGPQPPDPEPEEPNAVTPPTPEQPPPTPSDPEIPGSGGGFEIPPAPAGGAEQTEPAGTKPMPDSYWADLSVSTRPHTTQVEGDERVIDVVAVRNDGPSSAEGVTVDYQAPQAGRLIGVGSPRGRCSGRLPSTCRLGLLKPHQTVHLRVVMSTAAPTANFRMHTIVGSTTYDPRLADNTKNERVLVERAPRKPPSHFVPCRLSAAAHASC
ncbi:MAG TPA: hypothetical protein VHB53_08135 [Solirubrobacterales bacterium]|nr:hypothetical protein [Solirubrobacterales bacterium]